MHHSQLANFTAFNACDSHLKGFAGSMWTLPIKMFGMQNKTVRRCVIPVFIPIFDFRVPSMSVTCCNEKVSKND